MQYDVMNCRQTCWPTHCNAVWWHEVQVALLAHTL